MPQLRFPDFDDPWHIRLLEDIAIRGTGHTPDKKKPEYYNGGIKWVSLADSKYLDNGLISKTSIQISELGIKNSSAVLHPKGTVLLSRDAGVGKSAVLGLDMAVSQHFVVWNGKKEELDNWFLYYKLQILKPLFERMAVGNTIKTIGMPFFKKLKLIIPSYSEQQKIAHFLTAVDKRIQLLTHKKEQLELYKKGAMQKIFNREIRFKPALSSVEGDENGKDFPEWEEKKLGEVAKISKGRDISKSDISKNGKNRCIRYGELYTHYREVISKVLSTTNLVLEGLVLSKANDVIIPSSGETALDIARAACIIESNIAIGGDLNIIRSNENGVFLAYYLNNAKKLDIAKIAQGVSVVHLYSNQLKELILCLPSLKEQQKIAQFLTALDKKIEQTTGEIEKMKEWKRGLLQKMFV